MKALFRESVWPKRLLLLAMVAPVALLGGELFTRVFLPQNVDSKMNIFKSDPVVGYSYKPYAKTYEKGREYNVLYQINSMGLRDREYGDKGGGVIRVLLLGDSFSVSHGLPIEDSLSRQLERALQAIAGAEKKSVRIEVVNAATGGYSPYNYWKAYQRWAGVFRPDVVVVGLSPDDYDCSNEYSNYLIEGGETLAVLKPGQEHQKRGLNYIRMMRKWLAWNSEGYILLRNFLYYNDFVGNLSLWIDARAEVQSDQMEPYIVPQSDTVTKAWSKTFSYLRSLHRDASADGVVMAVIPLPLKMEIIPQEYQTVLKSSGRTPEQVDINQPLKGISMFCREEKIVILDPRPAMQKRQTEVPCYFVYDGHWNAEGIRAATAQIARQWRNLCLPPWQNISSGKRR